MITDTHSNLRLKIIIAVISLLIATAILELILCFILPEAKISDKVSDIGKQMSQNLHQGEYIPTIEDTDDTLNLLKQFTKNSEANCNQVYFAIFERNGKLFCAESLSPSLFGPPPEILADSDTVRIKILNDKDLCSCLEQQAAYSNPDLPIERISKLHIDGKDFPVIKWVCGDNCIETGGIDE